MQTQPSLPLGRSKLAGLSNEGKEPAHILAASPAAWRRRRRPPLLLLLAARLLREPLRGGGCASLRLRRRRAGLARGGGLSLAEQELLAGLCKGAAALPFLPAAAPSSLSRRPNPGVEARTAPVGMVVPSAGACLLLLLLHRLLLLPLLLLAGANLQSREPAAAPTTSCRLPRKVSAPTPALARDCEEEKAREGGRERASDGAVREGKAAAATAASGD